VVIALNAQDGDLLASPGTAAEHLVSRQVVLRDLYAKRMNRRVSGCRHGPWRTAVQVEVAAPTATSRRRGRRDGARNLAT
jgi:hypothetical protein